MATFKDLLIGEPEVDKQQPISIIGRPEVAPTTTPAQLPTTADVSPPASLLPEIPSATGLRPPIPAAAHPTTLRPPEERGGVFGDIGRAVTKGALQLPGLVAGVADIPSALLFGARPFTRDIETLGRATGFQPGRVAEKIEFSPEMQKMQQEISQIWAAPEAGAADIAAAYLKRPRVIATQIAESIPSMLLGGVAGRGLAVAGRAAGATGAGRGAGFLGRVVGEKMAIPVAAGLGEATVTAGQIMSQAEGENERRKAVAAIGAGLLTAAIGAGGGRLAQKVGLETPETLMAKGFDRAVRKELSLGKGVLGTAGRIAGGAVSESILQELPQSAQETVFQNYAEGKPLWEGVEQAAIEGAIAGFVMGAGVNAIPGAPAETNRDRASEQLLANIIPEANITVVNGMATIARDTPAGPTTITASVADISKTLASGGDINLIIPAEEPVQPAEPAERIFERLPDTETGLKFNIRGAEFQFEPAEGQTKQDLITGIEGKSNAAAIGWLRRNAEMTAPQAATPPTVPGQPGVVQITPGRRIFEKLPETDTGLRFRIRGTEFQFEPAKGQTKQDLVEGIEGKSNAAAIGWLRRNAKMSQVPPAAPAAPAVAEEVTPAAPAVAEEVTPAAPAVAEEVTPAAPAVAEEVTPAAPAVAEEVTPAAPAVAEEVTPAAPAVAEEVTQPVNAREVAPEITPIDPATPPISEEVAIESAPGPVQEINSVTGEAVTVEEASQLEEVAPTVPAAEVAPEVAPTVQAAEVAPEVAPTVQAAEVAPVAPGDISPETVDTPIVEGAAINRENPSTIFAERVQIDEGVVPEARFTPAQVEAEAKKFLGEGFDTLSKKGKLLIVPSYNELSVDIRKKAKIERDDVARRVVAFYSNSERKIFMMADKLAEGKVTDILRHEITHALFREDKKFIDEKQKILDEFAALAGTEDSVRDAFVRVPRTTPTEIRVEEALAYWLQDKKNQKHSLFKRIIAVVKAVLKRIGLPVTKLKPADLTRLFSEATQAWAENGGLPIRGAPPQGDALFSMVNTSIQSRQNDANNAVSALANPKSRLHNFYVQSAPQWLSVTPLRTMVQTFGKTIPQIKSFANNLDAVVSTKTDIVDTSMVKHYNAESAAKAGPGVDAFNRAAATASFNRMTPWEDILNQEWVPSEGTNDDRLKAAQKRWKDAKMQDATGLTFTQAYDQAKKAYGALKTQKVKNAYIDMVEHISSIRKRERNNLLAYIEAVSEEGTELRNQLMIRFNASFKSLQGAYWPLARFGDYILEYTDAEGKRNVQNFQTIAERNAAKDTIVEDGVDPATIKEDYKDKQPDNVISMPRQLMDQLTGAVEQKYLSKVDQTDTAAVQGARQRAQEVVNDMNQIWLRWQPETSALKNSIQRKNVKGFSEDMLRSYLDYMQRHASNIAWSEYGRKIDEDMNSLSESIKTKKAKGGVDVTMDRHILNDLRNRIASLRTAKVGRVASALGKLGTAYYMTSPSIALVQMSQLSTMTYPNLATKYGATKAIKALSRGAKEAFTKKFTREAMFSDPVVNMIYENMRSTVTDENRGSPLARGKAVGDRLYSDDEILSQIDRLNPYQKQLLTLREAMARNLLDISAAHEAYELTRGGDPNSLRSRAFNLAMLPMSLSELTSRKAAILTTKELSDKQGKNFFETMTDISDVVNDTLYSYAKEGKGAALQGGLSRVLLQFQHYRIMTAIRLALLFKNAIRGETPEVRRAATKEFVGIMGMTGALAGATGLPFAQSIFGVLNTVLGDEDEPEDYELMFTNWLEENLGETAAGVVAKGLPTLVGADISRRVGLADIYGMQNEPPTGLHGRDLATWWATSQLGPVYSVGQSWAQGYDEIVRKGNYLKGLEVSTPKPMRDVLKAYRVATEGLKTGAGKKILDDEQIGPDEIAMLALGFNADEVARAQKFERSLRGISTRISERRGKLISDAARAITSGEDAEKALASIRQFNKRMPRFAVTGRDIRPAMRRIILGELGATGVRERAVAQQYEIPVYAEQPIQPAAHGSLGELLGRQVPATAPAARGSLAELLGK